MGYCNLVSIQHLIPELRSYLAAMAHTHPTASRSTVPSLDLSKSRPVNSGSAGAHIYLWMALRKHSSTLSASWSTRRWCPSPVSTFICYLGPCLNSYYQSCSPTSLRTRCTLRATRQLPGVHRVFTVVILESTSFLVIPYSPNLGPNIQLSSINRK